MENQHLVSSKIENFTLEEICNILNEAGLEEYVHAFENAEEIKYEI